MPLTFTGDFGEIEFADPVPGWHRVPAKYHLRPGAAEMAFYDRDKDEASGVDGVVTLNRGFRGRALPRLVTAYVAATRAEVNTAWNADRAAVEQSEAPVAIDIPDEDTYDECFPVRPAVPFRTQETESGWVLLVEWFWEQVRPNV